MISDLSVEQSCSAKNQKSPSGCLEGAGKWASLNGKDDGDHAQNELRTCLGFIILK